MSESLLQSPSSVPSPWICRCEVSAVINLVQEFELMKVDYVQLLREHCKPGQPPSGAEENGHYLDLVGYWQDQCQKAQDECSRLQSINVRLERSNHQLSQQVNTDPRERPGTARPGTASSSTKRKAATSPIRAPKRPKPSVEQTVAQTQESIEQDFVFLDGLGDGKSALISNRGIVTKPCQMVVLWSRICT